MLGLSAETKSGHSPINPASTPGAHRPPESVARSSLTKCLTRGRNGRVVSLCSLEAAEAERREERAVVSDSGGPQTPRTTRCDSGESVESFPAPGGLRVSRRVEKRTSGVLGAQPNLLHSTPPIVRRIAASGSAGRGPPADSHPGLARKDTSARALQMEPGRFRRFAPWEPDGESKSKKLPVGVSVLERT